jgi:hypothetical protein
MWLPTLVVVAIADAVLIAVGLAVFTDRRLLGIKTRWRFSLATLLVAMAVFAVHLAIVVNLFYR